MGEDILRQTLPYSIQNRAKINTPKPTQVCFHRYLYECRMQSFKIQNGKSRTYLQNNSCREPNEVYLFERNLTCPLGSFNLGKELQTSLPYWMT